MPFYDKTRAVCGRVNFSVFTDYTTRRTNKIASEWGFKNQSYRVIGVNFSAILIKGKEI